jgi:hypothetical protein
MNYNLQRQRSEQKQFFPYLNKNIEYLLELQHLTGLNAQQEFLLDKMLHLRTEVDTGLQQLQVGTSNLSHDRHPVLSSPLRSTVMQTPVVPNLHLDKEVLTYNDVREILAYVLEMNNESGVRELQNLVINSRPDTAATQAVSIIGDLIYGPNNYIGPNKTGNLERPSGIIDIVTTVPILSYEDAQARAHDLQLTFANSEKGKQTADDLIINDYMRAAQQLRPYFERDEVMLGEMPIGNIDDKMSHRDILLSGDIELNPGPRTECLRFQEILEDTLSVIRVRGLEILFAPQIKEWLQGYFMTRLLLNSGLLDIAEETASVMIADILLVRGGIETNPGPYTWEEFKLCLDEIMKILGDPVNTSSYYNVVANDPFIDEQNYITRRQGTLLLKSALDDRTDTAQFQSNVIHMTGADLSDLAPPAFRSGVVGSRCTLNNRKILRSLPSGPLGVGLDGALAEFAAFLATERSQNNIISGDANLGTYSRVPRVDYGCSRLIWVLMLYECWRELGGGDELVGNKADSLARMDGDFTNITRVFPLTINTSVAGIPAIETYCLSLTTYTAMLRGTVRWPFGTEPNEADTAQVIMQPGLTPSALSQLVICHLEFPFVHCSRRGVVLYYTNGNGVPANAATTFLPWSSNTLIEGPRTRVFIVLSNNSINSVALGDGVGGVQIIPVYDPAVPTPSTDISTILINYTANVMCDLNVNTNIIECMDYALRFADIKDWYAACTCASSTVQAFNAYSPFTFGAGPAGMGIPYNGQVAPTVDASVDLINLQAQTGAYIQSFITSVCSIPKFSCLGHNTYMRGPLPPVGTQAPTIPTTNYHQNSSAVIRLAIYLRMLGKTTLGDSNFSSTFKVQFRVIWFILRQYSELLNDLTHAYWIIRQIQWDDVFVGQTPAVTNRRFQIYNKLKELQNDAFTMLCGYNPILLADPFPDMRPTIVDDPPNWMNLVYWIQHSLIMKNSILDLGSPRWHYGKWSPKPYINVGSIVSSWTQELFPNPGPIATFFGLVVNLFGRSTVNVNYSFPDRRPNEVIKTLQTMLNTQHLANPGIKSSWLTWTMASEGNGNVHIVNPILGWTNEFMRYSSGEAPSDGVRLNSRPILGITIPHCPSPFSAANGYRVFLAFSNQATSLTLRGCLSIDGFGSALFSFTSAVDSPLDYLYTLNANVNQMVEKPGVIAPNSNPNGGPPASNPLDLGLYKVPQ